MGCRGCGGKFGKEDLEARAAEKKARKKKLIKKLKEKRKLLGNKEAFGN